MTMTSVIRSTGRTVWLVVAVSLFVLAWTVRADIVKTERLELARNENILLAEALEVFSSTAGGACLWDWAAEWGGVTLAIDVRSENDEPRLKGRVGYRTAAAAPDSSDLHGTVILNEDAGRRDLAAALYELLLAVIDELRLEFCLQGFSVCRTGCEETVPDITSAAYEGCLEDCDSVGALCRDFSDPAVWCNFESFYTNLLASTLDFPMLRVVAVLRGGKVLDVGDMMPTYDEGLLEVQARPGDQVLLRIEEARPSDLWSLYAGRNIDGSTFGGHDLAIGSAYEVASDILNTEGAADLAFLVPRSSELGEYYLQGVAFRDEDTGERAGQAVASMWLTNLVLVRLVVDEE